MRFRLTEPSTHHVLDMQCDACCGFGSVDGGATICEECHGFGQQCDCAECKAWRAFIAKEHTFSKLEAECDARAARYKELHKDDPCERCGATEGVSIMTTASLAKPTAAICKPCLERMIENMRHLWSGYGKQYAAQRPWWRRLFG